MMRKQSALCFALMLAAIAAATPTDDSYVFRLKLQPNQTIKYATNTSMNFEMGGQDFGQTVTMTLNLKTSTAEKGTKVDTSFSDVKVDLPEGSPMAGSVDEMKRTLEAMTISSVYDERGTSTDVKVVGADASNPIVSSMVNGLAGRDQGFLGITYPEAAVKVGDTWTVERDLGKALGNTTGTDKKSVIPVVFKLDGVEGGTATITATTKGKADVDSPMGGTMSLSMDGTTTMHIEVSTGLIIDATSKATSEIESPMGTVTVKVDNSFKRA